MKKLLISGGTTAVVVVLIAISISNIPNGIQYFEASPIFLSEEDVVPYVKAESSFCNNSVESARSLSTLDFKTPNILPVNYQLQEISAIEGQVKLFYAAGPTCGPNAAYTNLSQGLLEVYIADERGDEAAGKGAEVFQQRKAIAQRPETVQLFQINSNPAIGWEVGIKDSIAMYENGTVVHTEKVGYPAKVQFIDTQSKMIYKIQGYFKLEDLKKIASSIK